MVWHTQAIGREHLRELLNRASGGVVFTTIHKFMPEKGEAMPEVSGRQNIVVIADEANLSQYCFGGKVNEKSGEMTYGFASKTARCLGDSVVHCGDSLAAAARWGFAQSVTLSISTAPLCSFGCLDLDNSLIKPMVSALQGWEWF